MTIPKLNIHPPLINTPCPAATTLDDLLALWNCPSTGAITTRTSLISGFDHDDSRNLYVFYDSSSHTVSSSVNPPSTSALPSQNATLNSLGYSPFDLSDYYDLIWKLATEHRPSVASNGQPLNKTIIISVTGSAQEIAECYMTIADLQSNLIQFELLAFDRLQSQFSQYESDPLEDKLLEAEFASKATPLAMEINLSCPNIPHHPPPAYSREALTQYLESLAGAIKAAKAKDLPRIPVGLKTPPYTYETQFLGLMEALEASAVRKEKGEALEVELDDEGEKESWSLVEEEGAMKVGEKEEEEEEELECPISFITATNTLGSCLAFTDDSEGALPTELGTGGLAGAPLHPLALGNVKTLRKMLDGREEKLGHRVQVIGVGGVLDAQGYRRMRKAGADVVGLASGLLLKGVEVFGEIEEGLREIERGWKVRW